MNMIVLVWSMDNQHCNSE